MLFADDIPVLLVDKSLEKVNGRLYSGEKFSTGKDWELVGVK